MTRQRRCACAGPAAAAWRALLSLCLPALSLCGPVSAAAAAELGAPAAPAAPAAPSAYLATGCAVGGVHYAVGAEVRGAARAACERCVCEAGGGLACGRRPCEPRPGCRALQRPDQCCPVYQCDCERDGRRYGNGEKVVTASDPCRVCYCQGGEVVCRRIACFVRADCEPRAVPGRCCPEYHNCPLRGTSDVSNTSTSDAASHSLEHLLPSSTALIRIAANNKQEITIKEVTSKLDIKNLQLTEKMSMEQSNLATTQSAATTTEASKTQVTPTTASDSWSRVVSSSSPGDAVSIPSSTQTFTANNQSTRSTAMPVATEETRLDIADDDIPSEFQNPAFPPLPDDFSQPTQDDSESTLYTTAMKAHDFKLHSNISSHGNVFNNNASMTTGTLVVTESFLSSSAGIIIKEIFPKENVISTPSIDLQLLLLSHNTSGYKSDPTSNIQIVGDSGQTELNILNYGPNVTKNKVANTSATKTSSRKTSEIVATSEMGLSQDSSTLKNMFSISIPTVSVDLLSEKHITFTNPPIDSNFTFTNIQIDNVPTSTNIDVNPNYSISKNPLITTILSKITNDFNDNGIKSSSNPAYNIFTTSYDPHKDSSRSYNLEEASASTEITQPHFTSSTLLSTFSSITPTTKSLTESRKEPSEYEATSNKLSKEIKNAISTTDVTSLFTSKTEVGSPSTSTTGTSSPSPFKIQITSFESATERASPYTTEFISPATSSIEFRSSTELKTNLISPTAPTTKSTSPNLPRNEIRSSSSTTTDIGSSMSPSFASPRDQVAKTTTVSLITSSSRPPSLPPLKNNNVLFDLIKLVGDVASIGRGEHVESDHAVGADSARKTG